MNNSFKNAINPGKYHVRLMSPNGETKIMYDIRVAPGMNDVSLDPDHKGIYMMAISYDHIHRIEIHACAFPYNEELPFLYIYTKFNP
jgi:hypothetical protein